MTQSPAFPATGDDGPVEGGPFEPDERTRQLRRLAMPLRGRHVAIAATDHFCPSARLFESAATALGARVSHLRPGALGQEGTRDHAAVRLLGTLYDAIDGVDLDPTQALELQRIAGVPVFADLGGPANPLRPLLRPVEDPAELQALVEAALIQSLA